MKKVVWLGIAAIAIGGVVWGQQWKETVRIVGVSHGAVQIMEPDGTYKDVYDETLVQECLNGELKHGDTIKISPLK